MVDALTIFMAMITFTLMLGLGASVKYPELKQHLKQPWPVLIGFSSQYLLMPFIAWCLGMMFITERISDDAKSINYESTDEFNDAFALGLLITGCMPGGSTSNLFCYYANGDVGLSIMMTLASTALACVMVPVILLVGVYCIGVMVPVILLVGSGEKIFLVFNCFWILFL